MNPPSARASHLVRSGCSGIAPMNAAHLARIGFIPLPLPYIFPSSWSLLTISEVKQPMANVVKDKQEAVALTTTTQEEILHEMVVGTILSTSTMSSLQAKFSFRMLHFVAWLKGSCS